MQDCSCNSGSVLCNPGAQQLCDCCISEVENANFVGFVTDAFLKDFTSTFS